MKKQIVCILFSCIFFSCGKDEPSRVEILNRQVLNDIYSLSGIEEYDGNFFVVSDNNPWLLQLNHQFEILDSIQIASSEKLEGHFIDPKHKPDFEGIAKARIRDLDELFVLGSGSKFPERNSMVRIQMENIPVITTYRMDEFFQKILSSTGIEESDLNIEGMAIQAEKLYLFNRGNNAIWEYDLNVFLNYLNTGNDCPLPKEYKLVLPKIKGVQASLSGANVLAEDNKILFSASVEDTENWLHDGTVLGSFIGLIEIDKLQDDYSPLCLPITENDSILTIKIESIAAVVQNNKQAYEMYVVTDSDGGFSEIFKLNVHF